MFQSLLQKFSTMAKLETFRFDLNFFNGTLPSWCDSQWKFLIWHVRSMIILCFQNHHLLWYRFLNFLINLLCHLSWMVLVSSSMHVLHAGWFTLCAIHISYLKRWLGLLKCMCCICYHCFSECMVIIWCFFLRCRFFPWWIFVWV